MDAIAEPELHSTAMTLAQKLRQEGIETGILKGRVEARRDAVIENLALRFGEPSAALVRRIQAIEDEVRLHSLHRDSLAATSLADFEALL